MVVFQEYQSTLFAGIHDSKDKIDSRIHINGLDIDII